MFSGIIRHTGTLQVLERQREDGGEGSLVEISSSLFTNKVTIGDSIAVQGVCLTVCEVELSENEMGENELSENEMGRARFFLSAETLRRSAFSSLLQEDFKSLQVHLEPSLRMGDSLDGHLVYGHVDTICRIFAIEAEGKSWKFTFSTGHEYYPYLASKGSVSLNGVSLTIGESYLRDLETVFTVYIIPHTFETTCFCTYEAGTVLNLEIDPVARYVVHALAPDSGDV